jgi:Flp pilus assembly pilin Flp
MSPLLRFLLDDEAATAVEYAVLLALILMAIIGAIGGLGAETGGMWGGINADLSGVGFIQ